MQLRTFTARSTAAVMAQIKEELGPDAVILETREEDGMIIMTAARERAAVKTEGLMAGEDGVRAAMAAALGRMGREDPAPHARGEDDLLPSGHAVGSQQWQEEWNSIKTHLLSLMKPALKMEEMPPRQRLAIEFLQREGVNDASVLELFARLKGNPSASILDPLGNMVLVQPWGVEHWPQRLQVIAGPFGAGKTSVAIRMALALRKESPDLRICLLNADATRGNGRLLLRHYAELSDMAYKEASTTMELVAGINAAEREGFDRILVDLPGIGRGKYLQTLLADAGLDGQAPGGAARAAVHLAMPPHYGEEQMRGMLERYRSSQPGSIVWTKLDEAEHFGQIVNVALGTGLPVSALSYGPGLGNSLVPAKETTLWRLLFKKELP